MIWREIRRRKVLRTCALYLVACWVLIQAADVLIPLLGYETGHIPRYLLYGGLVLFPVVVIVAWFYQVSPQGVQRSEDFAERRLLENIPPINDRRAKEGVHLGKPGSSFEWVLTAQSGPLQGLRYAINKPLLIGRAKDCDLALVSAHVSRHHARLTPLEDHTLLLEDLDSANGILVNGDPVLRQRLLHVGDVIAIKDIHFAVSESFDRAQGEGSAMSQETVLQTTRATIAPGHEE